MNGYRRIALTSVLLVALPAIAACQQPDETPAKASPASDKPQPKEPVSFERETKAYSFSYEYPADAAAIPALSAFLTTDRAKALAELESSAAEAEADAKTNGYPFHAHMAGISWTVTGNNPVLIAMLGELVSFSGGAHGNSNYEALLWDKAASKRITLDALFADTAAAMEPMRQRYCDALNAERAEKRGEYEATGDDMFQACPPFEELVILPYAGSDGGFDRLMLIAAPYVAGPYVEGAYEISLPIPAATLDQVKPAYRSAFSTEAR